MGHQARTGRCIVITTPRRIPLSVVFSLTCALGGPPLIPPVPALHPHQEGSTPGYLQPELALCERALNIRKSFMIRSHGPVRLLRCLAPHARCAVVRALSRQGWSWALSSLGL
ncbi:hypothetical protein BDW66DRAFT_49469 [Aspergillus desertorum]